ncbi:MAG: hypothetical protein ABSG42_06615 [Nitrospirota bacterium]
MVTKEEMKELLVPVTAAILTNAYYSATASPICQGLVRRQIIEEVEHTFKGFLSETTKGYEGY